MKDLLHKRNLQNLSLLLGILIINSPHHAIASQDPAHVQVPPSIKQEIATTQERFAAVLEEECPQGCFSVGCTASRFVAQDQVQNSSLPGLEDAKIQPVPQFKLVSVLCEFAYEPKFDPTELSNIKQRVRQKVKQVGIELTIGTRLLTPKVDPNQQKQDQNLDPQQMQRKEPPTLGEQLAAKLIPFIPWFLTIFCATVSILLLIWGWRKLGKSDRRSPLARTRASDLLVQNPNDPNEEFNPSPHLVKERLIRLSDTFAQERQLIELTLKKYLDEQNFDELISFVRHFGPDLLSAFKEKPEYREALANLSQKYSQSPSSETPAQVWAYLDRFERDLTAAKVHIDTEPLGDSFQFLLSLGVDEFLGMLRDVSDEEAMVAVSYAPRKLREQIFSSISPSFTAKFIEHLAKVEKMPDAFVRSVAKKLREIHQQKGESLRVVRRDTVPLFEEAINALEPEKRRQLLRDLKKANPNFLRNLAPAVFLDDSLPLLSNEMLEEVLMLVPPDEAAHYLSGYPWATNLLSRINPRLADAIRKKLPGAQSDSELAFKAREKMSQFIKNQHLSGKIDLIAINTKLAKEENDSLSTPRTGQEI